jgi:hypothetical protein
MTSRHPLAGRAALTLGQLSGETFLVPRELAPSAVQGLKLMCARFGRFDPRVMESPIASEPARDPGWSPVRQAAAIAMMAEETARAICPPNLTLAPLQPPPGHAIMPLAWAQPGGLFRGRHYVALRRNGVEILPA